MSDVQIAVIDQQDTQIVLAVPGVQGATGSSIPSGGTVDQVLRKNSSTNYDAGWTQVTSAMIANGTIVNEDVNNSAAIAGTKISPDFGGQAVTTTGQVNAARVNVTGNTAPSNGIYLPSSNNVGISTNGTGQLFIDADGEVGIGTGLPDGLLTLAGANSNVPRFRIQHPSNDKDAAISTYFDGSGAYLFVGSNHYVNSSGSNTKFDATSGSSAWYLDGSGIGIFYNSSGSGSITERLRIRADGTFEIKGGGTAGTSPAFSVSPSAPANSFVMLSDGKVGLGVSSVSELLHIKGGASSGLDPTVLIANGAPATSETASIDFGFNTQAADPDVLGRISTTITNRTTGAQASTLSFGVASSGSLATRMTLTGTGLHVAEGNSGASASTNSDTLFLENNGQAGITIGTPNNSIGQIRFADPQSDTVGRIAYQHFDDAMTFVVNDGECFRCDSSGRLLVGTSTSRGSRVYRSSGDSPLAAPLQIEGTSVSGALQIVNNLAGDAGASIVLGKSRGSSVGSITAVASGDQLGNIQFNGIDVTTTGDLESCAASIQAYVDGTPGANDMPGRLVFSTTKDGASSPTEAWRINSQGSLIKTNSTSSETIADDTTTTILTVGSVEAAIVHFDVVFVDGQSRQGIWAGQYTLFVSDAFGAPAVSYYLKEHWQDVGSSAWNNPVVTVAVDGSGNVTFNATNNDDDMNGTAKVYITAITGGNPAITTYT